SFRRKQRLGPTRIRVTLARSSVFRLDNFHLTPIYTAHKMIRLALNPDTTPLSISDTLVFKSTLERLREAAEAGFPAVNVDEEDGLPAEDPRRILREYGMEAASGFFHGAFYLLEEEDHIYDAAAAKAEFARALGQHSLFVSALVSPPE